MTKAGRTYSRFQHQPAREDEGGPVMRRPLILAWLTLIAGALAAVPAMAQQISGTPGAANATRTITGKQLPPPPPKFGGKVERNAAQSTPYWPARVVPPEGAPNVLLIMTDDTGFGVSSTFGGVIPTPNLDRIAANGLRYTNFNSTALDRKSTRLN